MLLPRLGFPIPYYIDRNLGIFTLFMSKYNFNVDVDVTNIIDESALNVCLDFAKYFQM